MKDYYLKCDNCFITSYSKGRSLKGPVLIVKYANLEEEVIPYNSHNEKMILTKMEDQIKRAHQDKILNKIDNKMSTSLTTGLMIVLFTSVIFFLRDLNPLNGTIFNKIFINLLFGGILINTVQFVRYYKLKEDYRKNKYFYDFKEKINTNLKKNINILNNTSEKTKEFVKEANKDEPVFNFNNLYEIPFKDFYKIMNNIKRNEIMNYSYEGIDVNSLKFYMTEEEYLKRQKEKENNEISKSKVRTR